ncbi:MAG: hypothetical protein LIO87_03165 [Eubacterium sp.]|nr:hypothetical protein [Eubacterium sp.]
MATKPYVNIIFTQLASTLIERSGERPVVILSSMGETADVFDKISLLNGNITEEDAESYTSSYAADLAKSVNYAIAASPNSLYITNLSSGDLFKTLSEKNLTNAIITAGCQGSAIADVTAAFRTYNESYGGTVIVVNTDDGYRDMHYICVETDDGVINYYDDDELLSAYNVMCMYAGAVAACGVERSLTNYALPCDSVSYAADFGEEPDLVSEGKLGAEMKGGTARVIAGINTAEVTGDVTEDMQYIEVVNTMDMIKLDITNTFVENYRGKYKNTYDNQLLFIAAVNEYFRKLANEDVLDPDYNNYVDINVTEQQAAWIANGNEEAEDWDEQEIKENPYKRIVYLKAYIKVAQSMESLEMEITLE